MKSTYTVWIGGIPDVEGVSLTVAKSISSQWLELGYDDVAITLDID